MYVKGKLDLVHPLCELDPVVLDRVLVLEQFPRAALVRTVDYRECGEQIVLQSLVQCLVGDSHVLPVLCRVQGVEVKCLQQSRGQKGTAETAVLLGVDDLVFLSQSVFVRVVDNTLVINRN